MEGDVPDLTRLLHTIKTFLEMPDPILLARFLKPRRLFHENSFHFWENPMKEGCFDVKMLYVPVKDSSQVHEHVEGLETSGGCRCLLVVDEVTLCEPFCDVAHFVLGNVALIIPFMFADQFPFEGSLTAWKFSVRYKDEDFQVHQTLTFITSTSNPVFTLWGGDGIGP